MRFIKSCHVSFSFFGLAIALILTSSALAQQEPPVQPPVANAPADNAPADVKKETDSFREQTIYIPYDKLYKVFEQPGRGVFLPYEKFQQLWQRANQNAAATRQQQAPLRSLIKVIDSEANVQQDVVVVTATLTIELIGTGWHEVPLNLADAAILSAKIGEQDARVVRRGKGYALLTEVPGNTPSSSTAIQLKLEYAKAFTRTPGLNQFTVQAPQASVNRWKIRVPEKGVKIQVQPMVAASDSSNAGDQPPPMAAPQETVMDAFFGATPSVVISWTPKAEGASGLKALATVEARQMVTISEGVQRTRAELTYQITRAKLSELTVRVPLQYKVTGVFDDNVRQWEVKESGEGQDIKIQLFQPTIGNQKLIIDLERFDIGLGMAADMQSAIVGIPTIEALNVARQQGILLVQLGPGLQAEVARRAGLLQVDAKEVVGKNWQFAYRYAALPFVLDLKVDKVAPEVTTRELVEVQFSPQRIRSTLTAVFEIKRAGVFQLGLLIPEGYRIRALRGQKIGNAQPLQVDGHHQDEDNPTRYDVNLSRKAIGLVGLFVDIEKTITDPNLATPTGESSDYPLEIPRVDPSRVEQVNGNIIVNAPISLRVTPEDLSGIRSVSFDDAFKNVARVQSPPSQLQPQHSYEYSSEEFAGNFSLIRRQPEVNVDQLMHVDIESGIATYQVELNYQILYSGVKTLRLDVPTSLVGTIRNTSNTIQESNLEPAPTDVAEGYTAWQLKSSQELIGSKRLTLTWQTEIGDLNIGSSTLLDLPYLAPQEVQRSSGQIVISKAENLDVVPTDKRENLRPIDPEHDLAGGRKIENASQAYEFHQDWSLQTKITRYDLQEIKPTAIERSVYRIRLDQNNNISVQAVLLVRSVNQRIGLAFPSGADMTSEPLKINGVETSLEYEEEADKDKQYYIPLRNASSDLPVLLEVNYRIKKSGGKIPVLAFDEETAVHDCYLFLQIPENWELIGYRGDWDDYLPGSWIDSLVGGAIALGMGDRTPQPESQQIIQDMQQRAGGGMVVQNPLIGNPIPFTSLDPQEPLTVTTLSARSLHLSVFALLGIFAIAGIRQKLANQFVMLIVLMALSIGIGIVLPLLSDKAFGAEAALTIVGIAVTWMILDLVQVMRDKPFPIFSKLFSKMETPPNAPNDSAPPGDKEPGEHQATETEEEEAIKLEPTEGDTAAEKLENTNTDVAENSDTADADAAPPPSDDSSSDDESNEEGSA